MENGPKGLAQSMTLERIYELHADFVFRNLRRLGVPPHDVADAIQEVFLTVHRALPAFEGRSSVQTWLFTICRSVARDRRRRAHRRYEVSAPALVEAEPDTNIDLSARLEQREKLAELERLLATIDEDQRIVFTLFELERMTGREIAEALAIPLGTVFSRLRLGRAAFRAALNRQRDTARPLLRAGSGR